MIAGSLEITTYQGNFLPKRVHPLHTCKSSLSDTLSHIDPNKQTNMYAYIHLFSYFLDSWVRCE
jgi:hypothetical protein